MSRRVLVVKLAPSAPPCFTDRLSWLEYLVSYMDDKDEIRKVGSRGPVDMRQTAPRFNFAFDFCRDCSARHALAMQAQGRCVPSHLRDMAPTPSAQSRVCAVQKD